MKQTAVEQGALSNPISNWALEERLGVSFEMIPEGANSLLDLGCGEGHFLSIIEKHFPSMRLVGVDLSGENIRYARGLLRKAKLIHGDATNVKLPSSSFDVVSALELLDHVESDRALLSEARRLLKPEGTFIVSIPDSSMSLWRLLWGFWTLTLGRKWSGKHLREYDEVKLTKLFEKEGFRITRKARAIFGCVMVFACEKSI